MAGQRLSVQISGPELDPALAWGLVGDTDWMNRVAANGVVTGLSMGSLPDGLPVLTGQMAGPAGIKASFEEAWIAWSRGRWFRQVRSFRAPHLLGTDFTARLEPAEGGGERVRPRIDLSLHVPTWMVPAGWVALRDIRRRWEVLVARAAETGPPVREIPDAARPAFARWRESDAEVVDRFTQWLRYARPTSLTRIRAFALADQWGLDRERVLDRCLAGVTAGALELYWTARCQRCYGAFSQAGTLSDLPDHVECPSCRLSTGTDLGENVEVLFSPHPSVAPRAEERYCTLYPAAAPEQHAIYTLSPGQVFEDAVNLPAGRWRLGAAGNAADLSLETALDGPMAVDWRATVGPRFSADAPPLPVAAGPVQLRLRNDTSGRLRVYLTRMGGEEPVVPAALLTARPAWRRTFAHEVLRSDLRLSVREITVLFTDLGGSTAMYEAVGDARAFAIVRDHFTLLRREIEAGGGVVVKTIGDAVMAVFHEPERAVGAALRTLPAFAAWSRTLGLERPLTLKVGLHLGPALGVAGTDGSLDWFGGTVNLAARAQGVADGGQLVLTERVWEVPGVDAVVAAAGARATLATRSLKGLGEVPLRVVELPSDPAGTAASVG